jgi:hypothetical protein
MRRYTPSRLTETRPVDLRETQRAPKNAAVDDAELTTAQESIVSEVLNLLAEAIWADFDQATRATVNSRGGTNHEP